MAVNIEELRLELSDIQLQELIHKAVRRGLMLVRLSIQREGKEPIPHYCMIPVLAGTGDTIETYGLTFRIERIVYHMESDQDNYGVSVERYATMIVHLIQ